MTRHSHKCHVASTDMLYHHRSDLTEEQLTYDMLDEVQYSRHLLEDRHAAGNQIDH